MSDQDDDVIDPKGDADKKPKAAPSESSAPVLTDPNHDLASRLQNQALELRKREKLDKEPYVKELLTRIKELETQLAEATADGDDDSGDAPGADAAKKSDAAKKKK